jgi:hypothetical protein
MKFVRVLVLTTTLLTAVGHGQTVTNSTGRTAENVISTNECVAKGGVGIVNAHLYINLKSAKNELLLDGGGIWADQPRETAEVVFFFENRVWSTGAVPQGFDLSKVIVISFEGSFVRFFDFGNMSGGYYRRPKE